jgi:excinuclease ABC subunit C
MLREVMRRRFSRFKDDTSSGEGSWAVIPDLILIDGGRGQLSSVIAVIDETGVKSVPVASLAKENEHIFIPQRLKPIILPPTSPGLQLLQRLRDEAHRFAVSYHRNIRKKHHFTSALDSVPGIGPRRKKSLLRQFGSVSVIKEATLEELATTQGLNLSIARRIKEFL